MITRRDFIQQAAAIGAIASAVDRQVAATGLSALQATGAPASAPAIDLAEWSYFWLGIKRAQLARGTVVNGEQMYVEYWIPKQRRHPYPIVMVHGGGGQGLDWFATPDGRRGWVTLFLEQGYAVYLVDRPGHGRSPFHPDLHGPFPERASTYEVMARQFTAPEKAEMPYGPEAKRHAQWPGPGVVGDPTADQVASGQGGSFLNDLARTHDVWAQRGGELLDKIGPAIVMAHSMGGPSCWIYANARPQLVKAIVGVEPGGPPFGNFRWGLTANRVEYDPPVSDPSELKTMEVRPAEAGRSAYRLQAEPARKLKNLLHIPIAIVTSPASYHWPYDQGSVAFLRQAGCTVEHIELEKRGIDGNAHFMMMERNNREVLQPILQFLDEKVPPPSRAARSAAIGRGRAGSPDDSTALALRDHGYFWTGVERRKMAYGTIPAGQMYVQYLIPADVRHETPIVLVHGGSAQMLHFMGHGDGSAGWAHYFAQAGYKVYLVDRPGHGRAPYHPDALGPISPPPTYEQIVPDLRRSAQAPQRRWPGTGEIGDPRVDQLMANQNARPQDDAMQMALWTRGGGELVDKIGPAIILTHSAGGPFGWLVADAKPTRVKAVVSFEGGGAPLVAAAAAATAGAPTPTATAKPRTLALRGIPMLYLTAENSGRSSGPAIVDALNASGARAEHLNLKDRGILGNGHFAMLETNRRQVFDLLRVWIDARA